MREWVPIAILVAAICATAVFFYPHPKKTDAEREAFKSMTPTQYFGYRTPAEVAASTPPSNNMEHILYLLLLCSTSGCELEGANDNPFSQIIRHHHYFPSLKSCETHLEHPRLGVIFPPDSQGRYHFSVKNASGEDVISDKWWECRLLPQPTEQK